MTKLEEDLMIYSDLLEDAIYMLADDKSRADTIIACIRKTSNRLCLNEKTKELIEQCEPN